MMQALSKKHEPYLFNQNPASHRSVLISLRRQVANRLQNPRLKRIHLHSFRHWKATMEFAKTKDVLWVVHVLGHKNIKNTQIYMHLADFKNEETIQPLQELLTKLESSLSQGLISYVTWTV